MTHFLFLVQYLRLCDISYFVHNYLRHIYSQLLSSKLEVSIVSSLAASLPHHNFTTSRLEVLAESVADPATAEAKYKFQKSRLIPVVLRVS